MDFAKSVLCSKVMAKNYCFGVLALSALRRLRVQSDLLDGTAFEALLLVVGSDLQKMTCVDTSLHSSTSWGYS